jgi:ribosomal protein S18 acetylase RimI-like enzyme
MFLDPPPWPAAACRGFVVITYRRLKNTDPPGLVDVWNDAVIGRGGYPLRTPGSLERWAFSKIYFEPDALIVAERDDPKQIVGFALAGFAPNAEQTALDPSVGVVCAVLVRQDSRRQGIGRELLTRAEDYLRGKGATEIRFGSATPNNPYLFGLYGGSNSPGVLASEALAEPFLKAHGYDPSSRRLVFQKSLDTPLSVADARFGMLRRRYEAQLVLRGAAAGSWWQECVWGTLEPSELRVFDKLTGAVAARAVVWELEGFSWRWGQPSAGIFDIQVRQDLRRQGIAKLVLLDILRFLQEQFFGIAELHVDEGDAAGLGLCKSLGFEQADTGVVWKKKTS